MSTSTGHQRHRSSRFETLCLFASVTEFARDRVRDPVLDRSMGTRRLFRVTPQLG